MIDMKKLITLGVCLVLSISSFAQQSITLSDLWQKYSFYAGGIGGLRSMNDGKHYSASTRKTIDKYSYQTGEKVATLLDVTSIEEIDGFGGYAFNANETGAILQTESESIYRYSSRSVIWLADFSLGTAQKLRNEKVRYATYSPNGKRVAYVLGNNLFVYSILEQTHTQITQDGTFNSVINGATDWVYEEEFALVNAFWWSPDSRYIGFFRFDESDVRSFNMDVYGNELYPFPYTFKYPKAGEDNSLVTAHVWDSEYGTVKQVLDGTSYEYLPRAKWSANGTWIISTMNRLQNDLKLYTVDASTGASSLLYHETDEKYLEINDELYFLEDGSFIMLSDRNGWNHLYHITKRGNVKRQITKGAFNVTSFYGIDDSQRLYYQSSEAHPTERNIYSIKINGRSKAMLTAEKGTHRGTFTNDFSLFVNTYSAEGIPAQVSLRDNTGTLVRMLKRNERAEKALSKYTYTPKEFFSLPTPSGGELNAWMIKPTDFDDTKEYPMFMYVYGGPGRQTVQNQYDPLNGMWFQMLANEYDMIVVSVDNHGTDGRSEAFKKSTYGQMGKLETRDQTEAALELSKRGYIDGNRIGIFGWSYGGYMASNCLFQSPEVFKMAIAVAPVTNWRFYDNIYTERYMGLPSENSAGYDADSPLSHVNGMSPNGKYMLIHGTGDDNVHVQNSMRMVEALVQADKDFKWFAYPDKNHGISGGNSRMHLYRMMTNFIQENL
ncbi:MAG: S9 family peptidase [Flavobacteriales bacterium]|nr:S9 family peptidase [Flavobacteriales bacterium]|tara:strand:- start:2602 stop:4761 length:2160 start_codon:yes stop_codon:yes gene_type:complete